MRRCRTTSEANYVLLSRRGLVDVLTVFDGEVEASSDAAEPKRCRMH